MISPYDTDPTVCGESVKGGGHWAWCMPIHEDDPVAPIGSSEQRLEKRQESATTGHVRPRRQLRSVLLARNKKLTSPFSSSEAQTVARHQRPCSVGWKRVSACRRRPRAARPCLEEFPKLSHVGGRKALFVALLRRRSATNSRFFRHLRSTAAISRNRYGEMGSDERHIPGRRLVAGGRREVNRLAATPGAASTMLRRQSLANLLQ